MARVSQSIDGLLHGVSEQPEAVRLPQAGVRQVNFYDKIGRGKVTRPPSEHVAFAPLSADDVASMYSFLAPDGQMMTAIFVDNIVRLMNAQGETVGVNFPTSDAPYLETTDPIRDIRCVTVGDVTYIANLSKVVQLDATSGTAAAKKEALVVITQGALGASYSLSLSWTGGSATVRHTVPDTATVETAEIGNVTNLLWNDLIADSAVTAAFDIDVSSFAGVIYLKRKDGSDFSVFANDSIEGAGLKVIKGAVDSFTDLPKAATIMGDGMTLQVKGSPQTQYDDYWVSFGTIPATGEKGWREVAAPGVLTKFDPNTFLWQLSLVSGEWTCEPCVWEDRKAGDDTTCPVPSFVGKKLTTLFYHGGRLALCAVGGYVVLSQAAKPLNFWRQSATALLADDVIDVKPTTPTGDFHTAMDWLDRLWLWTPKSQYVLSGDPVLTPQTVSMDRITSYENDPRCAPVVSGQRVFFVQSNNDEGLVVNEYSLTDSGSDTPVATNVNAHAPTYVRGVPRMAVADDSRGFYAVLAEDFTGYQTIYVYVYANRGGERVQQSWSEWTPPADSIVRYMSLTNGVITYLLTREDGGYLEVQNLDHEAKLARFDPEALAGSFVDRRVIDTDPAVTVEYNGTVTTYTLPYLHGNNVVIASLDDGAVFPVTYVDEDSVSTPGNLTDVTVVIGTPYECVFELSPLRWRNARTGAPRLDGRLMLQNVVVEHDGATLTIDVTNGPRPTVSTGVAFDKPTTHRLKASAFGNSLDMKIELRSKGPGLCAINNVVWEGAFIPTIQRVG